MAVAEADTSAVLAKLLAMAFLGISSFTVGSVPMCVFERLGMRHRARDAANFVLKVILNFGGGVLLCTTFLHLLPEVREGVEKLTDDGTLDRDSPLAGLLAELIMCIGFFFMYSVEELVHGFVGGDCHAHSEHHHSGSYSVGHYDGVEHHTQQQRKDSGCVGQCNPGYEKEEAVAKAPAAGKIANYNSCSSAVQIAAVKSPPLKQSKQQSTAGSGSILRGFLVVGALSIHELFEGLAVGLEKDPKQVWSLAVAVACHKLVIAFYVGLQMLSDRTKPVLAHCSILLFAVTSPLGIGLGTLVSNLEETHIVIVFSVVLQGLATGTLMYVVFYEVLKPSVGRIPAKQRMLRLLFVAVGFSSMLSIQLIISD